VLIAALPKNWASLIFSQSGEKITDDKRKNSSDRLTAVNAGRAGTPRSGPDVSSALTFHYYQAIRKAPGALDFY
jgi:hypothetical protein